MSEVFDGLKRTVKNFHNDFIGEPFTRGVQNCEECGRRLDYGVCPYCDGNA